MQNMQNLIKNNKIISHLITTYAGNYIGYQVGYHLTRSSDRLMQIVNGYIVGFGTSVACNAGLFIYTKYLEHVDQNKNIKQPTENHVETLLINSDLSKLMENETIASIMYYYCI